MDNPYSVVRKHDRDELIVEDARMFVINNLRKHQEEAQAEFRKCQKAIAEGKHEEYLAAYQKAHPELNLDR